MFRITRETISSPHQLAGLIQEGPPPDPERLAWMAEVGSLLNGSEEVWGCMYEKKFNENNFGHVTLNIYDTSHSEQQLYRSGAVEKIEVCFHDHEGVKTTLGGIKRIKGSRDLGVAFTFLSTTKTLTDRLTPENEACWEAVVGTIRQIIESCQAEDTL